MLKEVSYGIVPLRKVRGKWQTLLVQHGKALYWGFPKGHGEEGEDPKQAAARELFEETGLTIKKFLSDIPFTVHYFFRLNKKLISKEVLFFPALVTGKVVIQEEEIGDSQWIAIENARDALTYPTDKKIMEQLLLYRTWFKNWEFDKEAP